ncbi:T9SS type A sorting domain-containing protein [Hymenobacter sp. BT175]|uniref:T9SS type A sorting domain-containing protein n=1 Tax=Hymenobacter translucens TaxID=2886507 RepID=UPI001D0E8913|nr:T9SS type A sorting domain-containing protein [Hymenobacter translucens]MCC2545510.1 T9SS type A sorting domain-containing protein [Hymenobacter translucens]
MKHRYTLVSVYHRFFPGYLLALLVLLLPSAALAQAPAWAAVAQSSTQASGTCQTIGMAVDASGNVFATGIFSGTVAFGSTVLTSAGNDDIFVAKYVPSTNTWAWAQRGGGANIDRGFGIAVSGNSVYVTGYITNNLADDQIVRFGGSGTTPTSVQVNGASSRSSRDLLVAKYTDSGTSATLVWTQVGGGTYLDEANGIAVSGSSVYVTGAFANNTTDDYRVRFGGSGTTPGTVQVKGASTSTNWDLVVAKYVDNGSSATLVWTQVGGGHASDSGFSLALSGSSLYVSGYITNNLADDNTVRFGGSGTTRASVQVNGASANNSLDLLVAKYTDNGSSAALIWTQVGGGIGADIGYGLAVKGTNVYVTGDIANNLADAASVRFGGSGTTPGTLLQNGASTTISDDLVVAKYTDNGPSATVVWTQVGGGTGLDRGQRIEVSGTSLFVTGVTQNSTADANRVRFGGSGTAPGTVQVNGVGPTASSDFLVAKYTDNGTSAALGWTKVSGGAGEDWGRALAVSGQNVLVSGLTTPSASFDTFTITNPVGVATAVLAHLRDPTLPLAVARKKTGALFLYPNPAHHGTATLTGAEPGLVVQVLDALGRPVLQATVNASGAARLVLPQGLASGVYVVRAGTQVLRLAIE